jgi:hypothetical protein
LRSGAECAAVLSLPGGGASPAEASVDEQIWQFSRRGSVAPTLVVQRLGSDPAVTYIDSRVVVPLLDGRGARWQRTGRGGAFVVESTAATVVLTFERVRRRWFLPSELFTTLAAPIGPDTPRLIVLGCYLMHLAQYDEGVNAASAIAGVLSP